MLKKKSKRFRKSWKRYYLVLLDSGILNFYTDEASKSGEPDKQIEMEKVKTVCFHYYESAPKQSKKVGLKGNEESRFDVYMVGSSKKYQLKSEGDSLWISESWVETIKELA